MSEPGDELLYHDHAVSVTDSFVFLEDLFEKDSLGAADVLVHGEGVHQWADQAGNSTGDLQHHF